jgi:hypothetical protein
MLWIPVVFIIIVIYFHIYIHFCINSENEILSLSDVCKTEITTFIYKKQPFLFNGSTLRREPDFSNKTKSKNTNSKNHEIFVSTYEPLPLLEPTVKFFPSSSFYKFNKTGKSILETNLECRSFYRVHTGTFRMTCIHPKYKEHFTEKHNSKFIKEHEQMLHVEVHPDTILFIPNYWFVYIEPLSKDATLEKIQFSTILNQANFLYKKYIG